MLNKEVEFLKIRYEKVLSIIDIQRQAEADTVVFFDFNDDNSSFDKKKFHKYSNPFYDKFEENIRKIRDSTLSFIVSLFHHKYANTPLSTSEFDAFIDEDKYGNKGIKIDFAKVQEYLDKVEKNRDILAVNELISESMRLIPHDLTRGKSWDDKIPFKTEGILKNNKLVLYSGYSYTSPNTQHVHPFLKLINVILNNSDPSTAEEYDKVYLKYYKNGRMDADFGSKADAKKVAEYLEKNQNGKK